MCWNNQQSEMLSPCPAALHLLVLTNNCPACRAFWDYGREQDFFTENCPDLVDQCGNLTLVQQFLGGRRAGAIFLFDTGRSPALTHFPLFCCQRCLIPVAGWRERQSDPSRSLTPGELCVNSISCKSAG